MATSQDYAEYIRTLIRDDIEANDQIEARLDREGWGDGFAKFIASLFFLAVDRRFGEKLDRSQIIRFVADMRADLSTRGEDLDAHAAETLISSIIDPSIDYHLDQATIGKIQGATIYNVLRDASLTDEELDRLIAEATDIAARPV
jgi:hypothetical protein